MRVATIRQLYYLWLRVARGKQRRDYAYIDTSHVETSEPRESNLFLHYQPELTQTPGLEKQYLIIQTPAVFLEEKKAKKQVKKKIVITQLYCIYGCGGIRNFTIQLLVVCILLG